MNMQQAAIDVATVCSAVFGFGWQSSQLKTAKTDINNLRRKHDEVLDKIDEMKEVLIRIDERVKSLKSP
jgi:hypothetical protein